MTAPMRATPRLSAVPASQNTAPVAEFHCLFTHDTRKKQKKWQDGFLKFHSFNSRVIVYDMSRFSVGDTYYKDSPELHEGDELMLDKGIMVEVAEPVGVTQTDLTPLFERKVKDSPLPNSATGPQKPPQKTLPRPTIPASNPLRAASQLRHKSLNTLLGASRAPIGKAVPIRTPYEERVEKENRENEERAAKRQKITHAAPAQQPARPTTTARVPLNRPTSATARPSHQNSDLARRQNTLPHNATVISLSSQPEVDNIPSDVTLPYTPCKPSALASPAAGASVAARKEPPACTTPRLPKGKVPVPHIKARQTPQPPPPPSSPPVSASNRITNVQFALELASNPPREPSPVTSPPQPQPPPDPVQKKRTKTLKFSNKQKRGMLLCQSVPVRKTATPGEPTVHMSRPVERVRDVPSRISKADPISEYDDTALHLETAKHGGPHEQVKRRTAPAERIETADQEIEQAPLEILDDAPLKIMNDPELVHGFMDQQLLVASSPPVITEPVDSDNMVTSKTATSRATSTKKAPKNSKRTIESPPAETLTKKKRASPTQTKSATAKPTRQKKSDKQASVPRSSSPATPLPTKPTSLSAGGFKKKTKKPPTSPPNLHLPPHPLRSTPNGPLISTSELSTLLTHGPASICPDDDPIEDASQDGNSPSKRPRSPGLKRSRSENDAPIPNVSGEWEARNLKKGGTTGGKVEPKSGNGLAGLIQKTDPRRKFVRTRSLGGGAGAQVEGGGGAGVGIADEVKVPDVDEDVGPWSTEAFDLFDWRPPGKMWVREGTGMKLVEEVVGRLVDGK